MGEEFSAKTWSETKRFRQKCRETVHFRRKRGICENPFIKGNSNLNLQFLNKFWAFVFSLSIIE
jgi:hypothetical protein